jgi:hypothetical protein
VPPAECPRLLARLHNTRVRVRARRLLPKKGLPPACLARPCPHLIPSKPRLVSARAGAIHRRDSSRRSPRSGCQGHLALLPLTGAATLAAQPFGKVGPSSPPLDGAADPGALGQDIPRQQHAPQQPQQQPFATSEAQARSFEDVIRSRPTMQLQPPSPWRPSRATYNGDLQHQSKQQQSRYMHPDLHQQQQRAGQYYSTWPPPSLPPSEARGVACSPPLSRPAAAAAAGRPSASSPRLSSTRPAPPVGVPLTATPRTSHPRRVVEMVGGRRWPA